MRGINGSLPRAFGLRYAMPARMGKCTPSARPGKLDRTPHPKFAVALSAHLQALSIKRPTEPSREIVGAVRGCAVVNVSLKR